MARGVRRTRPSCVLDYSESAGDERVRDERAVVSSMRFLDYSATVDEKFGIDRSRPAYCDRVGEPLKGAVPLRFGVAVSGARSVKWPREHFFAYGPQRLAVGSPLSSDDPA